MCGIWLLKCNASISRDNFYKIQHRGPDISTLKTIEEVTFGIHRLAINGDDEVADQPFYYKGMYCVCNGEIYNYKKLAEKYGIILTTGSDCEIILPLFDLLGPMFVKELIGEFAIIIVSEEIYVFRDHFGKRPLFIQYTDNGEFLCISSEMKGMYNEFNEFNDIDDCKIKVFPPREYAIITDEKIVFYRYYDMRNPTVLDKKLREIMRENIEMMVQTNKKIGALLSGGLDSSIVVYELSRILPYKMNTYSIGLPGGTDEKYARLMSEYAGTNHTHIYLTEEIMREAIPDIVYTTESYDITTIRASIGQYIVCKYIDEKVLFVGEGPDEFASGYKYFHNAPSLEAMHNENIERMENIHLYDGLRMDRCPARFGIEVRAPFMIHTFVDKYLSIDPKLRIPGVLTKELLREIYRGELPEEILSRPKEAFSDGMTAGLSRPIYEILRRDDDIVKREYNQPTTSEASYYRVLWEQHFSNPEVIKSYWMPKWCTTSDPSALTIKKLDES